MKTYRALLVCDRPELEARVREALRDRPLGQFVLELRSKQGLEPDALLHSSHDAWIFHLEENEVPTLLPQLARRDSPLIVIADSLAQLKAAREQGCSSVLWRDELSPALLEHAIRTARGTGFLSQLVDSIADPIFVKDEAHRWIYLNDALCSFMGYAREQLLGKSDYEFFPKEQADVFWEKDDLVFSTGESNSNEEPFTDAAGKVHIIATKKARFEDAHGRRYLVGVIRDITERRELDAALIAAREDAIRATHSKSAFLATMSHEIRTPMNGVIGMTDILLGTELSLEQRELMRIIKRSGEHLISIINSILDFSKLEAGKLKLDRSAFNLRDSVEQVLDLLAPRAHQKGLELIADLDAQLPRLVIGDPSRFGEVLLNLVGNAIKFTDRGHVMLSLRIEASEGTRSVLRLEVNDTGVGIPEGEHELVFEAYAHRPSPQAGTGLGLAIARQLIELMGGQLGLSSQPAQGSSFGSSLPFETVSSEEGAVGPITGDLVGQQLVLVSDHPLHRQVLARQLEARGIALELTDKLSLLPLLERRLREQRPASLLAIDEPAGTADSQTVLGVLRSDPRFAQLPVLVLTTLERTMRNELVRDPAIAYLAKPALDSRLFEALRALASGSGPRSVAGSAPAPNGGARLRVLVAEDNGVSQEVTRLLLDRLGYDCDVVGNGQDAVEQAARADYAAVLMDCEMPVLDGFSASRQLRARDQALPIIALTATVASKDAAIAAGMNDYLLKPVDLETLRAALAHWLQHAR